MLSEPENKPIGEDEGKRNGSPELKRSQKIAVAVLAVFALFVIVLWTIQFKKGLTQPFVYKGGETSNTAANETCAGPDCPETIARQKAADTDHDGLNDYDELYIYRTSPYLPDSDSDGIADGIEVKNSTDPNCPEGKKCNQDALTANQNQTAAQDQSSSAENQTAGDTSGQDFLSQLQAAQQQSANTGTGQGENSGQTLPTGEIDAKSLRQLLLDNGMQKSVLDQISDEQLMQSFEEVMSQQ